MCVLTLGRDPHLLSLLRYTYTMALDPRLLADPSLYRDLMRQMQTDDSDSDSDDEPSPWSNPRAFIEKMELPIPASFPTPEEVRKEARDRSREIFAHWTLLNRAIERYEASYKDAG